MLSASHNKCPRISVLVGSIISVLSYHSCVTSVVAQCPAGSFLAPCELVLVIGAVELPLLKDVSSTLEETRAFRAVDIFDARFSIPTIEQLSAYDAVVVFSYSYFFDPVALGNHLATYHNMGGGIVIANSANERGLGVLGAYGDPANGYALMNYTTGGYEAPSDSLGTIEQPFSPLLKGVRSFRANMALRSTAAVLSKASVVARWQSNGRPLILQGARGGRTLLELNFFPPSIAKDGGYWYGDGGALLRNALKLSVPCSSCFLGTFSTVIGTTSPSSCAACPVGTFSVASFATACGPCPAGTYATGLGTVTPSCTACALGTSSGAAGATAESTCAACAQGSYSDTTSASACESCRPGTYSALTGLTAAADCAACAAGTFSTAHGSVSASTCALCPPGSHSTGVGAASDTTCGPCGAGTYSTAHGAPSDEACAPCPVGTRSTAGGATSAAACAPCTVGSYASSVGNTVCALCAPGTYASGRGTPSPAGCRGCALGTFSTAWGADVGSCSTCANGKFAAAGQTTCAPCAPGTSSTFGQSSCSRCSAGTHAPLPGSSACATCPADRPYSQTGATVCSNTCPPGLVADPGQSTCAPCSAGSVVPPNSTSCVACPPGSYSERAAAPTACGACGPGERSVEATSCPNGQVVGAARVAVALLLLWVCIILEGLPHHYHYPPGFGTDAVTVSVC
jgi:hypothetical protein